VQEKGSAYGRHYEVENYAFNRIVETSRPVGLIGGTLSLYASLAPFRGWFHFECSGEFGLQTSSRNELTRWILSWIQQVNVLVPR
jgi:hypothetical protein